MASEYRHNHYAPVWYQKCFLPPGQADRELLRYLYSAIWTACMWQIADAERSETKVHHVRPPGYRLQPKVRAEVAVVPGV